jgi:hypothetical protein
MSVNMKKIVLVLSLSLAFGASAQDGVSSANKEVFDEIKSGLGFLPSSEKKVGANSEVKFKSELRNKKFIADLEAEAINAQINVLTVKQERRKMEYLLKQPVEDMFDDGMIKPVKDDQLDSFLIDPNEGYDELEDQSMKFSEYSTESYSIDQLIVHELPKERPVVNNIVSSGVQVVDGSALQVKVPDANKLNNIVESVDDGGSDQEISDELLAEMGMSREELNMLVDNSDSHEDSVAKIDQKRADEKARLDAENLLALEDEKSIQLSNVPLIYSDLKSVSVDKVVIFGGKKMANLVLTIYVGDGINGETSVESIRGVKEGDVIKHKGFDYKISSIRAKEIEVTEVYTSKIFISKVNI